MVSRIVDRCRQQAGRAADFMLRRHARASRWAEQALPERRLHWHGTRLSECAVKLEKRFLHISVGLENLAGRSDLLLESSRRLLKYSLGHEGGASTFGSAVAAMERPLTFYNECLVITNKVDHNLGLVAGRIGRLNRFKAALDASIAPLKILQTMFRIESAASSPEVQSLFTSLSAEIERLLVRMSTMIVSEFDAIESTGATVNELIPRLRAIRDRQIQAQTRRVEIGESLRKLDVQFEANKARDVRLLEVTKAVADKLAGMVGALQFQDILNQRLQHVMKSLGGIADQARAVTKTPTLDALTFLRDASRVESAHLEDIESVLGGAMTALQSSLHGLSGEMGDVGTECILLNGIDSPSAACDGMVEILLETIAENLSLVQSTYAQSQRICSVLEPISELLGNLTGSILELSARIRLIALNGQIQAAQAGEGTGLEILSSRTRLIAEEMASIVAEIADELAALKQGLREGLQDVEHTRSQSLVLIEFLSEEGKEQQTRLHEFRNQMLSELRTAGDLIAYVQTEAKDLSESLDVRSSVLEVVICAREELEEFSRQLGAKLRHGTRSSRMEHHGAHYTAEAERSAHERALRGSSEDELTAVPSTAMAEGTVELF